MSVSRILFPRPSGSHLADPPSVHSSSAQAPPPRVGANGGAVVEQAARTRSERAAAASVLATRSRSSKAHQRSAVSWEHAACRFGLGRALPDRRRAPRTQPLPA
eukprot:3222810-Rhodomonas_salina.2